jgi:hypothetical protein
MTELAATVDARIAKLELRVTALEDIAGLESTSPLGSPRLARAKVLAGLVRALGARRAPCVRA